MRALEHPSTVTPAHQRPERLAELGEALMSAATELAATAEVTPPQPAGVPVHSGRLHVGRVRRWLPSEGPVEVAAGFATACWLGAPGEPCPDLGRLVHRSETAVDRRGRVVIGRQARAWLEVRDPAGFEVVVMAVATGGVLVVPVEGFARRFEAVTQ